MTTASAPKSYKLELLSAYGPVFRDVLKSPPRDCDASEVPIIDLSDIRGSEKERRALAMKIRDAAQNTGFFYIKNHGIPKPHIDAAFNQAQSFFAQPVEKKAEVSQKQSKFFNGWSERRETSISPTESRDHREGFSFRYDPKYDPESKDLAAIPEKVKECLRDSVVNYYPKNTEAKDAIIDVGLGAHTDLQCFTFLWQDSVGGLQVLTNDGQWIKVPPVPDTFVVNIGDFLMRLSNDRFKSTVHRVYNYAAEDRYSMPFFFGFNFDEKCTVLPSCIDEENPAKYEPISCGETKLSRHESTGPTAPIANGLFADDQGTFNSTFEHAQDPADQAVKSAPVIVLRELDYSHSGGYRKPRALTDIDIVNAQLLKEETAKDLIQM
ncbi:hypothetical protein QQX98_000974 [Neonectria punicea]|uniref:Fe2OG dioxygenase domain-containing protein n=1 Tax=Neonectria punicea TaxID=979145 RepID=A0ABR1HR83_9HYPO